MKVFISWSGEQTRTLGHALQDFIEMTFASHVHTFLSDADIAPGERFLSVIHANLSVADLGILLVTRSNQHAPWLVFEAGALAGKSEHGSVIPVLVDLDRSELQSPLNQFQNILGSSQDSIHKLCERIHRDAGAVPAESTVALLFEQAWPKLELAIQSAQEYSPVTPSAPPRNAEDMLSEILVGVSALVQRGSASPRTGWTSPASSVRDNGSLTLDVGQRLRHADFGDGTVAALTGEGAKTVAHVVFDDEGPKKLLVKIAPIEVI